LALDDVELPAPLRVRQRQEPAGEPAPPGPVAALPGEADARRMMVEGGLDLGAGIGGGLVEAGKQGVAGQDGAQVNVPLGPGPGAARARIAIARMRIAVAQPLPVLPRRYFFVLCFVTIKISLDSNKAELNG